MQHRESQKAANSIGERAPVDQTSQPMIWPKIALSPTPQAPEPVSARGSILHTALSPIYQAPELVPECVDSTKSHPSSPVREQQEIGLGIDVPPSPTVALCISDTQNAVLDTTEYEDLSSNTSAPAVEKKKTRRGARGSRNSEAAKAFKTARITRRKERRAAEKAGEAIAEEQ
ncbi:hypothetical protein LTR95_017562 [Oleoguttula sp. CCFEE 5521]